MIDPKQLKSALNNLGLSIKKDDDDYIICNTDCAIEGQQEVALLEYLDSGSITISPFSPWTADATFSRIPSQRKLEILLRK